MSKEVEVTEGSSLPTVSSASVPKLSNTNFNTWKMMIEMILKLQNLQTAITNDKVDESIDMRARLLMLGAMDEVHRSQVIACQTAKKIMMRLELLYADTSAANIYRLMLKFYRYKKVHDDSIAVHVGKMDQMAMELKHLGKPVDDEVYQISLIGSLPSEYENLLEVWELTHPSMKTTANLVSRLIKREEDIKETGLSDQAFTVRKYSPDEWRKLPIAEKKKLSRCKTCKKRGHWAKECPDEGKGYASNMLTRESSEEEEIDVVNFCVTLTAGLNDSKIKNKWVADSGATKHMANNQDWFHELKLFKNQVTCKVGDGKKVEVKGIGSIKIVSTINGNKLQGILTNVLYIPTLAANLFSIGAATKMGINTTFNNKRCLMKKEGRVIAIGNMIEDNLYLMEIETLIEPGKALIVQKDRTIQEWHKAMGHPNRSRLLKLAKGLANEMIVKDKTANIECGPCAEGKGKQTSHPLKEKETPKLGGKVHADLSGKVNKDSLIGAHYYLMCKDEFSEYCFVYFLKNKSEVPRTVQKFIVEFEHKSDQQIKEFCTDNGSEFMNEELKLIMLKERIYHTTSAPYTPQQNGIIEREMGSINGMARSLMFASNIPGKLWPWAVEAAVYLRNRLPTSNNDLTPYERLTGRKPSVKHIIEFGTRVHVVRKQDHLKKFDSRTEPAIIVGYTFRSNTYQVYLLQSNRVVQSCDIIIQPHTEKTSSRNENSSDVEFTNIGLLQPRREHLDLDRISEDGYLDDEPTPFHSCLSDESATSEELQRLEQIRTKEKRNITVEQLRKQRSMIFNFFDEFRKQNTSTPIPTARDHMHDRQSIGDHSEEETVLPSAPIDDTEPTYVNLEELRQSNQTTGEFCGLHTFVDKEIPQDFNDAVTGKNREKWRSAIASELESLKKNQTWTYTTDEIDKQALTTKWVFAIKRNKEGKILKYKARLVVRGFEQRADVDYFETFAPVARQETVRSCLALAAARGMYIEQFDVVTAFLNGTLDEDVYIKRPEGVKGKKYLKLDKALYGLKQAPKAWNDCFTSALIEMELKQTLIDPCLFVGKDQTMFVLIYVDDGLIIGNNHKECLEVLEKLKERFELNHMNDGLFLGIEIHQQGDEISISQKQYIKQIIEKYSLEESMGRNGIMFDQLSLMQIDNKPSTAQPYRQALGCLQYLANATRPDILYAVNFLARFNQNPSDEHWEAILVVVKYLINTIDYSIRYKRGEINIMAYSDANWARPEWERHSTSGGLILLAGGPVVYFARRQSAIALSTAESEYLAAGDVCKELVWIKQLLSELGIIEVIPRLLIDNQSAIRQIKNTETLKRSKHIDLRFHFIRDLYKKKIFLLEYVNSNQQLADYLTKLLSSSRLKELTISSGLL